MTPQWNGLSLGIFASRLETICDEMGVVLQRTAFSPNIKDRLDFSCAVFSADGELCAQAAHIPVHLGSMAYAMQDLVRARLWQAGDVLVLNDPYAGGTHLPDVTLLSPVFVAAGESQVLAGFVANRAHHANIGASSPGSMPLSSHIDEEGLFIQPQLLKRGGQIQPDLWRQLLDLEPDAAVPAGDFLAQLSANESGVQALTNLITSIEFEHYQQGLLALNDYAQRLANTALAQIPIGEYQAKDCLDSDGSGQTNIAIKLSLAVKADGQILADFSGSAEPLPGNLNCSKAVVAAAVFYALRCLMPAQTPVCAGTFRGITLTVPEHSLLNAQYPAAVAAGNVETSMRLVDVVFAALAQALPDKIPAASHGSMNNIALGSHHSVTTEQGGHQPAWHYYETIGGGSGAGSLGQGASAIQCHMTNSLNTPIESLEMHYPLRVCSYRIRRGSGGLGKYHGGDGIVRELELLAPAELTLLTERRHSAPPGAAGGEAGQCGRNWLNGKMVADKCQYSLQTHDRVCIETPGGGGFGLAESAEDIASR